jgi:hypothetical protein
VVWAIDVVALLILIRFLPGLDVTAWMAAVAAVAVIGLLNALVWLAKMDVPANGVQSRLAPGELERNLDPKPAKK